RKMTNRDPSSRSVLTAKPRPDCYGIIRYGDVGSLGRYTPKRARSSTSPAAGQTVFLGLRKAPATFRATIIRANQCQGVGRLHNLHPLSGDSCPLPGVK